MEDFVFIKQTRKSTVQKGEFCVKNINFYQAFAYANDKPNPCIDSVATSCAHLYKCSIGEFFI